MGKRLVSPSILAADFANLEREVGMLNRSEADYIHLDVMDGVFVPNISFGMPVIASVGRHAKKPLDAHLMIVDPDRYIDAFAKLGVEILTVHYEACTHLHRTIQAIHAAGMKAGVSLNPATPVALLEDILADLDLVLIMSVNPGFGGQKFIPNSLKKVRELRAMIDQAGFSTLIEIDGGVDGSNYNEVYAAGVDMVVAGSYVFGSSDPVSTIASMKQCSPHGVLHARAKRDIR